MEKYYYARDPFKKPRITVCLLKEGSFIAKGIAICANQDNPSKRRGRSIAHGRAKLALFNSVTSLPIKRDSAKFLSRFCTNRPTYFPIGLNAFKSEFMPVLEPFERRLLFGLEDV